MSDPSSHASSSPSASWRADHRIYQQFVTSTPILYDTIMNFGLTWPSLSVQWVNDQSQQREKQRNTRNDNRHKRRRRGGVDGVHPEDREDVEQEMEVIDRHLLIGSYTDGQSPNSVHLARVRLPNSTSFDPFQEFLRHPLASSLASNHHAAASSTTPTTGNVVPAASSSSTPSTSARSRTKGLVVNPSTSSSASSNRSKRSRTTNDSSSASSHLDRDDDFSPTIARFDSMACEYVTHLRAPGEIHRIRPFLMQSSFQQNLSASRILQAAHASELKKERDESTNESYHTKASSDSTPALSSTYTCGLFAIRDPEPDVKLYDINQGRRIGGVDHEHDSASASSKNSRTGKEVAPVPLLTLTGHSEGGWPLDWSGGDETAIVTADDGGSVCLWHLDDAQTNAVSTVVFGGSKKAAKSVTSLAARRTWTKAHPVTINDIAWVKVGSTSTFFTVGDDSCVKHWDVRSTEPISTTRVGEHAVETVSTAPFREFELITGGKDNLIQLWDIRNMKTPKHVFSGHGDEVRQVAWAPFDHHGGSVFASSSADRRIFIWDASLVDTPIDMSDFDESGPPELLFVHFGHTERVEDFSWHPTKDWLMASVGEENVIQVWEVNPAIYRTIETTDKRVVDEITQLMTTDSNVSTDGARDSLDVKKLLSLMPEQFQTSFLDAPQHLLKDSVHFDAVTQFVQPYGDVIHDQLTELAAQLPSISKTENNSTDWNESLMDESISSSTHRRSGRLISVKVRSNLVVPSDVIRSRDLRTMPIQIDSQSAATIRTLQYWDLERRTGKTKYDPAMVAAEFETALAEVLALVPNEESTFAQSHPIKRSALVHSKTTPVAPKKAQPSLYTSTSTSASTGASMNGVSDWDSTSSSSPSLDESSSEDEPLIEPKLSMIPTKSVNQSRAQTR